MIRGVLFDLDGVLYNGEDPIPGAAGAVEKVRQSGVATLFVTNTTSRPRGALVAKLAKFGIRAAPGDILTPPVAAAAWIRSRGGGAAALFVPDGTRAEFAGLEAADDEAVGYVVIGDLAAAWDYHRLNKAFRLLHGRPERRLVALGLTRFWQSSDGANLDVAPVRGRSGMRDRLRGHRDGQAQQGVLLASGPSRLGLPPGDLLMIGDDLRVDVLGAQGAGLRSALVRTGKFRPSDLDGDERPDWVLDSARDLPALLANGDH